MITVELTTEERDLIVGALRNIPVHGTIDTLPALLEKLNELLLKLHPDKIEEAV